MVYKITVKPNSSFIGDIKANTLFGAFCYTYSNIVDDKIFKEELDKVVFSDMFYENSLPEKIKNGEVKYKPLKNGVKVVKPEMHNIIDRGTGRTSNNGGLHNTQVTFSKSNMIFFMSTSLDKEELENIMKMMLLRGLGARKSTGKGSFSLVSISKVDLDYTKDKKVVALSDFVPDDETSTNIEEVKIVCREGITLNGEIQKPIYMLSVGSVFVKENNQRETCGKLLYDKETNTYINAKTILYPVA